MTAYRPGDGILDRLMPDADERAREEARANLTAFMAVMLRIAERETGEQLSQNPIRAATDDSIESRL